MLQHSPSKRFFKNLCVCKSFTISLAPLNGICRRKKRELDQDGIQWVFQKRASSVWFMLGKSFGLSSFIVTQTGKKEPSSP